MVTTALASALAATPAWAQQMAPATPAVAQLQSEQSFDIPAQPLTDALVAFGQQSGIQVTVNGIVARDISSPAVHGKMTSEEALRQLLAGSGLIYTMSGSTVAIERPGPGGGATMLGPITVEAQGGPPHQAEIGNLPQEYAGGKVARGGKLGLLGNKDFLDTPYSQTSFTSKLIEDQQASFVDEVLRNDPAVQIGQPASTGFLNVAIRGFDANPSSFLFDGLPGLALFQLESTGSMESFERVEVLRGPSGLLNCAGSPTSGSNIGGTVNLVPKRADDAPLTRVTGRYISDAQGAGHVDVGRRFGKEKKIGVRVNAAYRTGDLPIDHASRQAGLLTAALDYRGDEFRATLDPGYEKSKMEGGRFQLGIAPSVTSVPAPPDNAINWNAAREFNDVEGLYGVLGLEYDVTSNVTAFLKGGGINTWRKSDFTSRQIEDNQGGLAADNEFLFDRDLTSRTLAGGLRSVLDTGPVRHQLVAAYTQTTEESERAFGSYPILASNIYNPVFGPASSVPGFGELRKNAESKLASALIADTLSVLHERVQLMLGVRRQQISATNFDTSTGAVTSDYDKNAYTPTVALVVKPLEKLALYASYIEGLEPGSTAPATAVNAGEVFAPSLTESYEIGAKVDFGRIGATLALYQTTRPSAFIDPATNLFVESGEQRHRGAEAIVFGEVTSGIRVLGGASYVDARLTKTAGGVNQGNRALTPEFQLRLGAEWDVPFAPGLTLSGLVSHASSQYVNLANTQEIPSWTQLDLGARYKIEPSEFGPLTLRASVTNALDSDAWSGPRFGGVVARDPLTVILSVTADF
jgi:iron complex outermembrane receptor protein